MQDPVREITGVVKSLVECKDATVQQVALKKYFTQDASFDHPLCAVTSRNGVGNPLFTFRKKEGRNLRFCVY